MFRWMILLPLAIAPQEKPELTFTWGLPPGQAAEYEVYDTSKDPDALKKDRPFLVLGTELYKDGGNRLVITTYEDLPWTLTFTLPPAKTKVGTRWNVDRMIFDRGSDASEPDWAFRPVQVRGTYSLVKIERVGDADCARVDGAFSLIAVKTDGRSGERTVTNKEVARITTSAWFSLDKTMLVRGRCSFKGRGDEFVGGFKQGEMPRNRPMEFGERIELKKELLAVDPAAQAGRIHDAIRNGVAWLRTQHQKDGRWKVAEVPWFAGYSNGVTALAAMAMVHSGVPADDPQVRAAFAHLRQAKFATVYEVSSIIMALESIHLPLEKFEDVEGLTEQGARAAIAKTITPEDRAFIKRAANWLLSHQAPTGTWGYPHSSDLYDHSNTQYAMLALKSASRRGVEIGGEVWRRAAEHWIESQQFVGGPKVPLRITWGSEGDAPIDLSTRAEELHSPGAWTYLVSRAELHKGGHRGYGSMTCAGLASLLIAESELARLKEIPDRLGRAIDLAKKQGLAWLQENFSAQASPPESGFWSVYLSYYLYSLERVGVLYGIRKFGDRDWYAEGALTLVKRQSDDGSWNLNSHARVFDTALALLFLKKATVRVATKRAGEK